jgi:protein tyrosine/serine phosphatase
MKKFTTPREAALALEQSYKTEAQKRHNSYPLTKKAFISKTNWIDCAIMGWALGTSYDEEFIKEATRIYNERNDNDEPWFK